MSDSSQGTATLEGESITTPTIPLTIHTIPPEPTMEMDKLPRSKVTTQVEYSEPHNREDDKQTKQEATMEEMLRHHNRLAHVSFERIKEMARQGLLPRKFVDCPIPSCTACLYGKAIRKKWRSKSEKNLHLHKEATTPGAVVSVDQLESPTPGLIAQISGFVTTKRYKYATVYVDQASRLGYVHLQKSASVEETIQGKKTFEKYAQDHGVIVRAYHADNGIFRANKWVTDCRDKGQTLTYAGVNAHHQNGVAERRIRTLQELTRTMLIHATRKWPKTVTVHLWPYALRMANDVLNSTPSMQDKRRRSPLEIFTDSRVKCNPKEFKPFGCPTYCLKNELQAGQPFHKWKERSRLGIYMGKSPYHARNVALVLDKDSGYVSPQFHVVCDSSYRTVREETKGGKWRLRTGLAVRREPRTSNKNNKDGATPVGPRRLTLTPTNVHRSTRQVNRKRARSPRGERPLEGEQSQPEPSQRQPQPQQPQVETINENENGETAEENDLTIEQNGEPGENGQREPRTTRSGRIVKPRERLIEAMTTEIVAATDQQITGELFAYSALTTEDVLSTDIVAEKATTDPDTMYWHEAMKEPDREEFVKASIKEVEDQIGNGIFSIVPASEVPEGVKPLPAVWQMKRKRDIRTRKVKKWKARLNIDGSKMRPDQYDLTYAPVASWNSIRLLLGLTTIHNWHTIQIDYVLAFPQAPVERELYMEIPKGFEVPGASPKDFVLKIHRNIYGQKQAGKVWNDFLVKKLTEELGFKQSRSDECVLYKGNVLYVLYTDDSILAGPNREELEQVIEDIKKSGLNITVEGDLQDFLGVRIDRMEDGGISLTQPQLIDQILKDLRMDSEEVVEKDTPAMSSKILKRHQDEPAFDRSFDYRSVVGKLNYLEKGSRPDIAYISHQCARFTADPRKPHADAIRWLARYLKGSRKKGTIIRPDPSRELEVFVDADFSGNWDAQDTMNPDTARSRHGYVICYGGCPIIWKSQLQTEIALSSTESEYTGLSYALREAIPIMDLLKELKAAGFPIRSSNASVRCKVFEDNSGALEMAKTHKYRPRTKHINVKLHHFRQYVDRKEISIHRIATDEQPADILTKPVNKEILERHRRTIMGW